MKSTLPILFLCLFGIFITSCGDDDCAEVNWYQDTDGDGFGNPDEVMRSCDQPEGYVTNSGDCDDSNKNANSDTLPTWYKDADADGYGDPSSPLEACTQPEGYVTDNTDCNDSNKDANPESTPTWYEDADGDGFGNPDVTTEACTQPDGYVADNTDCDDTNKDANPDMFPTWFIDADGDNYGDSNVFMEACTQPEGYVADDTDCDDSNADINPGAEEDDSDGIDSNCDGKVEITNIWLGPMIPVSKPANADWTDPQYQDRITDKVVITRQNNRPFYNYQWWQDEFGQDPTSNDLKEDFYNGTPTLNFTPTGGTKGIRWAILNNSGDHPEWDSNFTLYGTLGEPDHFYSLNNVVTMITNLNNSQNVTEVVNDFTIKVGNDGELSTPNFKNIVGIRLGAWLVEDNIYVIFTFTSWGEGQGPTPNPGAFSYERSTEQ